MILIKQVLSPISSKSSLYLWRPLSTATQILYSSRFYNPKIATTMIKNQSKHMQNFMIEEIAKQHKESRRKGPKTVAKDPVLFDNNRTKVFNRQFKENIGDVMARIPELIGHGINITKVNVLPDYSEVRIFWVSSRKDHEEVSELLEANTGNIRKGMYTVSGLGKVPKLVFVLDLDYLHMQQMDELFNQLQFKPGYSENLDPPENLWRSVADTLKLASNAGGLDRDKILNRIRESIEKSKAVHRHQYRAEDFLEAYRETIHRHGLEHKQEVKSNIRKFLSTRKKKMKEAAKALELAELEDN